MEGELEKLSTKSRMDFERPKRRRKASKPHRAKPVEEKAIKPIRKRACNKIFISEAFDRWMNVKKASAFKALNNGRFANHLLDIHDAFCNSCKDKKNNSSVTKDESDHDSIESSSVSSADHFVPPVFNGVDDESSSSSSPSPLPLSCELEETKEEENQADLSLEPVMVVTNPETGTIETIQAERKNPRKPIRPKKTPKISKNSQELETGTRGKNSNLGHSQSDFYNKTDQITVSDIIRSQESFDSDEDSENNNFNNNRNNNGRQVISISEKFISVLQEEKSHKKGLSSRSQKRNNKTSLHSGTLISKKSRKPRKSRDQHPPLSKDGPPRKRGRPRKDRSLEDKFNHQWMCPKCGKICNNKTNVKRHMQVMHLDKKHVCPHDECNKKYATAYDLKLHEKRIHLNIKPAKLLSCPYEGCLLRFSSASRIKKHLIKHTGERPFLCTQCGKGFKRADNLKVHERQHTDEKPVECKLCDFTCRQKASLNHHMQKHHSPGGPPPKKIMQHPIAPLPQSPLQQPLIPSTQIHIPPLPPHPHHSLHTQMSHHPQAPHMSSRLLPHLESDNSLMPLDSSDFILTIL